MTDDRRRRTPTPHHYDPDPDTSGYCRHCGLLEANSRHDPEAIAAREAENDRRRAVDARIIGETSGDG